MDVSILIWPNVEKYQACPLKLHHYIWFNINIVFDSFIELIQVCVVCLYGCLYALVCMHVQFRFASCQEILMMIAGSVCAVLHGSAQPLMLLVFGLLTDTFIEYDIELNELNDDRKECVNNTIQWKQNYTAVFQQVTPLNQSEWGVMNNSTWEMFKPLEGRPCGYVACN